MGPPRGSPFTLRGTVSGIAYYISYPVTDNFEGQLNFSETVGLMFFYFFKQASNVVLQEQSIRWSAITCCCIHLGLFGSALYYIKMEKK